MSQVLFSTRRWFSVARLLILTHVLIGVIVTIWNLPAAYQKRLDLDPGLGFQGWTQAQLQAVVQAAGITPGALAALLFAFGSFCLLSFWGVAALLAWRKSDTWIGLLIIYILAVTAPGFSFLGLTINGSATDFFEIYTRISATLGWPTFFMLLYLFPDGRFIPRWTRWLAPLPYLGFFFALWNDPQMINDPQNIILGLLQWFVILYAVGGIASQVVRYRRESGQAQRQQTKWVVYALGILVVNLVITQIILVFDPDLRMGTLSRFWFDLFGNFLFGTLMSALIPLSIGISILRYRLWDIDLVIRRTLIYGVLSGAIALIYFGGVTLLQWLFTAISGQQSPASIVVSTLLIFALFSPLRRRVQSFIDRRFYRQKYDAARTLEAFSTAVRSEVNLAELTGHLEKVVDETVQPQGVSLWLRKDRQ